MNIANKPILKYSFSGHDTFQCRHLWLKKGFDYVNASHSFNDESAVVILGVGKNMVSAIHYWMKAFDLLDTNGNLTIIARYLLADDGKDPYLEDEASLWLLHFHLVKRGLASIYSLIFNEFRREKIEFTKETFILYVKRKLESTNNFTFNSKTISTDFDIFIKMYKLTTTQAKDIEESSSGLLTDLNLVKSEYSKIDDNRETHFYIDNLNREEIPAEVIMYSILTAQSGQTSISLNSVENGNNSVGSIFAINRSFIIKKIEQIIDTQKYSKFGISLSHYGGIRELQFRSLPLPFEILNEYYEK